MPKPEYRVPPNVAAYIRKAGRPPAWYERWMTHVSLAWTPGGEIVQMPDGDAPEMTLARYGFLLPLYDDRVRAASEAYKASHGLLPRFGLPDDARRDFERAYILANRETGR